MKKTVFLIAALLMMGCSAFAGGDFDFGIGPKIGYQTARLSYDKADIKSGFSNHFTVGVFGRIGIGQVYVQPELLYFKTTNVFDLTVKGENASDNLCNLPTGANARLTLNAINLQVPILLGINLLDLKIIALRAQAGLTANFTLQSKALLDKSYTIDGNHQELPQNADNSAQGFDTKTISWGLQAGLGADLLKFITLDINYNFGLSNVFGTLNNTTLGNTFDFSNIDGTTQNMFIVTFGIKLIRF